MCYLWGYRCVVCDRPSLAWTVCVTINVLFVGLLMCYLCGYKCIIHGRPSLAWAVCVTINLLFVGLLMCYLWGHRCVVCDRPSLARMVCGGWVWSTRTAVALTTTACPCSPSKYSSSCSLNHCPSFSWTLFYRKYCCRHNHLFN